MYNQVVITWLLLLYSMKSGVVFSPAPSLDCFGSSGLLWFHTNFRMIFPIFLKNAIWILIKIVLNLQMSLGCMKTLTIFILPMQEYKISFHLQVFLTFWKFASYSFTFTKDTLVTIFISWKKSEENYCIVKKKVKSNNHVQHLFCNQILWNRARPEQQEWSYQSPFPGITLSISASSHHNFELCQWSFILYLNLFYVPVGKMCLKVIFALSHFGLCKVL